MNAFWAYFWPPLGAGIAVGILAGAIGFRPSARRNAALAIGAVAAILRSATLWHGPLGASDRLASDVERRARATIVYYEIPQVSGASASRSADPARLSCPAPPTISSGASWSGWSTSFPGVSGATGQRTAAARR